MIELGIGGGNGAETGYPQEGGSLRAPGQIWEHCPSRTGLPACPSNWFFGKLKPMIPRLHVRLEKPRIRHESSFDSCIHRLERSVRPDASHDPAGRCPGNSQHSSARVAEPAR